MEEKNEIIEKWKIECENEINLGNLEFTKVEFEDNLKIYFHDGINRYCINFYHNYSFRVTDESFLLQYWNMTNEEISGEFTYKIINSRYIKALSELSIDFTVLPSSEGIEHYCLFFRDDCIEVLSEIEPDLILMGNVVKYL